MLESKARYCFISEDKDMCSFSPFHIRCNILARERKSSNSYSCYSPKSSYLIGSSLVIRFMCIVCVVSSIVLFCHFSKTVSELRSQEVFT